MGKKVRGEKVTKKVKIDKTEFDIWTQECPVLYASTGTVRFYVYPGRAAYRVTVPGFVLYDGPSFDDAKAAFEKAQED